MRARTLTAILLAIAVALPASAHAATLSPMARQAGKRDAIRALATARVDHQARNKKQKSARVMDKLARVRVPTPTNYRFVPGWPAGADTSGGGAGVDLEQATVYMGDNQYLPGYIRAQELGDLLIHQTFKDPDKRRFARLLGGTPEQTQAWLAGEAGTGFQGGTESLPEWLADHYATLAVGAKPGEYTSYAPQVGPRKLLRIGRALERLGERNNLKPYRYQDPFEDEPVPKKRRRGGSVIGSRID